MGTSLALRAAHRGPYIPGFDVLGASAGLMFVAAEPAEEFLREYTAYRTSEFPAWNVIVAPAILPGVLAHVFPWEYWPHAVTLALFVLTLGLLGRGLDLRGDEFPSLLLAWACSSTLVSHAIVGLPYLSNTLPFGVALWVVLRTRHWLATLVLCLLTTELAWHAQELGRTVFMVFLAAGLLLPGPTWSTRAIWLATGAGQVVLARSFPSFNTKSFTRMTLPSLAQGLDAAVALGQHFLLQRPDLFIVLPIAACVIWLCGRQRWFWLALVGGQFALIFLLAANSGTLQGVICVWPRRTVVLTFVAIGAIVAALRHMGDRRRWLRRALLLGALVQLGHTIAWASRPLDARDPAADFTLPYTETKVPGGMHLDMRVPFLSVRWYLEMREKVDGGATVLLLYNLSSYDENATDPAGIPDRLHLHLGHAGFTRQVLMFGSQQERWAKVPVRPLSEVDAALDDLDAPETVEGYWMHHELDDRMEWEGARTNHREIETVRRAIESRFHIEWAEPEEGPGPRTLHRFRLRRREGPPAAR